jgi:hypothetical protein
LCGRDFIAAPGIKQDGLRGEEQKSYPQELWITGGRNPRKKQHCRRAGQTGFSRTKALQNCGWEALSTGVHRLWINMVKIGGAVSNIGDGFNPPEGITPPKEKDKQSFPQFFRGAFT